MGTAAGVVGLGFPGLVVDGVAEAVVVVGCDVGLDVGLEVGDWVEVGDVGLVDVGVEVVVVDVVDGGGVGTLVSPIPTRVGKSTTGTPSRVGFIMSIQTDSGMPAPTRLP